MFLFLLIDDDDDDDDEIDKDIYRELQYLHYTVILFPYSAGIKTQLKWIYVMYRVTEMDEP